jgi:formylglycine-generating enzyme required for sulfatase activity
MALRLCRFPPAGAAFASLAALLLSTSSCGSARDGERAEPEVRTIHVKPIAAPSAHESEDGPGSAPRKAPADVVESAMVRIPPGSFRMGSGDGNDNERPVHEVKVAGFLMDVTEVTVRDYEACIRAGRCSAPWSHESCNSNRSDRQNHPVNCVDWRQATAFCAWLGKRLPSEEEWEYAARGTDGRTHPWGAGKPGNQLCWDTEGTCEVGSFPSGKSPFGVLDMAGNVAEWTSGLKSENYLAQGTGDERVTRGGSWSTRNPFWIRASVRFAFHETNRLSFVGFRCVRASR